MENTNLTYPTYEQIATLLSHLATNYSAIAENFTTVFYDTTPKDVTFSMYDKNGALISYTIPNRAKDFNYIKNGEGTPESVVSALVGTIYQDTLNGKLYIKKILSSDPTIGWQEVTEVDKSIELGAGDPNNQYAAPLGTLYIDTNTFKLYVKTIDGGKTGWQAVVPPYDTVPTQDSTNGITSGAVYTAINTLQIQIGNVNTVLQQINGESN